MIKITKKTEKIPVYDIEVKDNHNFFANGLGVHNCENDEHTYVYDRTTDVLTCCVCGSETTAAGEMYSGWATDAVNGKYMYFVGGKYITGSTKIASEEATYFDKDGYAYDGTYTINGESCRFEKGNFVGCDTASVITAGSAGDNIDFILYSDGRLVFDGQGAMFDCTIISTSGDFSIILPTSVL